MNGASQPRIIIVGAGLAGMSAAWGLLENGWDVRVLEARRRPGGRAGSFADGVSGQEVDYCQHVAMNGCTNLLRLLGESALRDQWTRHDRLTFVGPDGRHCPFRADPLPAPLHLGRSLLAQRYLSRAARLQVIRGIWRMMRSPAPPHAGLLDFLAAAGQGPEALAGFWSVVMESALGERIDRVALGPARKVILEGFVAERTASAVWTPDVPLSQLFGVQLPRWLADRGVRVETGRSVQGVLVREGRVAGVRSGGTILPADAVVVAVPWHQLPRVLGDSARQIVPASAEIARIPASPISGIHLWLDRAPTTLPHAVLVGRLSQWLFRRPASSHADGEHYCQVVISAARALATRSREEIAAEVLQELGEIFPAAKAACLLHSRVVTDPQAVFSATPAVEQIRPETRTPTGGLFLAGDYTATDWPATMEGAVISGLRAAESIRNAFHRPATLVQPSLRPGALARLLIRPRPDPAPASRHHDHPF